MQALVILGAGVACYLVAKFAYQEGKADGEESGFNNGIKFAHMREQLWDDYENGKAN